MPTNLPDKTAKEIARAFGAFGPGLAVAIIVVLLYLGLKYVGVV